MVVVCKEWIPAQLAARSTAERTQAL